MFALRREQTLLNPPFSECDGAALMNRPCEFLLDTSERAE